MASRRLALLIGNGTFDHDQDFPNLRTPANDAQDFANLLQKHGDFKILGTLIDATHVIITQAIEDLFNSVKKGDLALLYYSGHGYRGRDGEYYLIAKNSRPDRLWSTAIPKTLIHSVINHSSSRHRVMILDCCFSGAFIKGRSKGGVETLLLTELKGQAEALLASSRVMQHSFEEDSRNSIFTQYLLQGIETGQADEDEDGLISIVELFDYTYHKVKDSRPEQEPDKVLSGGAEKIYIVKNPKPIIKLPPGIEFSLQSDIIEVIIGAINGLGRLARSDNLDQANLAQERLKQLRDSQFVRQEVSTKAAEVLEALAQEQLNIQLEQDYQDLAKSIEKLNWAKALSLTQAILTNKADFKDVPTLKLLLEAQIALEKTNYSEAIHVTNQATATESKLTGWKQSILRVAQSEQDYQKLGILVERKAWPEALSLTQSILAANPNFKDVSDIKLLIEAEIALRQNKYLEAVRLAEAVKTISGKLTAMETISNNHCPAPTRV